MSMHPNTLLLCILTPDDLARTTYRAILDEHNIDADDPELHIGDHHYLVDIVEDADEGLADPQIDAPEGSIVVHGFLTYGYRKQCSWDDAARRKEALELWAQGICRRHHCSYTISLSANYW